jgi:hypothetical protein
MRREKESCPTWLPRLMLKDRGTMRTLVWPLVSCPHWPDEETVAAIVMSFRCGLGFEQAT